MDIAYGLTWLLTHHDGWGRDGGGWWWLFGPLMLAFWIGLTAAAVWFVTRTFRPRTQTAAERAADVLADRYARGEISTEEYRERLDQLQ
jgi:putative membrane protein